jgi:prepilin-type N-terminal cleavage/methylation domain-containing protein/prepilin-type processing-associated H-X9-DG protein
MNEKGTFTLIELLVVIAIIAILAAMLMPALEKARNQALTARCQNQMKNTALAFQFYSNDWDGYISESLGNLETYTGRPFSAHSCSPSWDSTWSTKQIMYCPAYDYVEDELGHMPNPQLYCSDIPSWSHGWSIVSYNINGWLRSFPPDHGWVKPEGKPLTTMTQLVSASKMILMGEPWRAHGFDSWDEMYYNPKHGGRSPVTHADGHVEMHPWRDPSVYGRTGFFWAPNHGVKHSFTVLSWGNYLHPRFSKWNLIE